MTNCCPKHHDGILYGECKLHSKCNFSQASSLTMPAINKKHNILVGVVFYNNTFWGSTLKQLLQDDKIFVSFPLSEKEFIQGNIVTDFTGYETKRGDINTAFNDIQWLWPRKCTNLYLCDWNWNKPLINCKPIIDNWYNIRDTIYLRLNDKLNVMNKQLSLKINNIQVK